MLLSTYFFPCKHGSSFVWFCSQDGKLTSKKGLKKQQKEAEKAAKKQQRQDQAATEATGDAKDDCSAGLYGNFPLIQSKDKPGRSLLPLKDLTPSIAGQKVWVRGRLYTSRTVGELLNCFLIIIFYVFWIWPLTSGMRLPSSFLQELIRINCPVNKYFRQSFLRSQF